MSTPISASGRPSLPGRSKSEPILNANSLETLSQPIKPDSVTINPGKTNPTANPAKASKPLYQVIIDFFQELGQKIMDFFTPTSKEAIEKALLQSELKMEAYSKRIANNKQHLKTEGLSELKKEVLNQDIQKTQKKLEKYLAKADKLGAKLDKLASNTAQATEAKVSQGVKTETATEASSRAGQQSATEGLEKATQESMEGFLKEAENLISKAKESFPEIVDNFAAQLKKALL